LVVVRNRWGLAEDTKGGDYHSELPTLRKGRQSLYLTQSRDTVVFH